MSLSTKPQITSRTTGGATWTKGVWLSFTSKHSVGPLLAPSVSLQKHSFSVSFRRVCPLRVGAYLQQLFDVSVGRHASSSGVL